MQRGSAGAACRSRLTRRRHAGTKAAAAAAVWWSVVVLASVVLILSEPSSAVRDEKGFDGSKKQPPCALSRRLFKKKEYYKVLGIKKSATEKQIKSAYKAMAKQCHPDKNTDNPNADDNFMAISGAYQILSDKNERYVHDQGGHTDPFSNGDGRGNGRGRPGAGRRGPGGGGFGFGGGGFRGQRGGRPPPRNPFGGGGATKKKTFRDRKTIMAILDKFYSSPAVTATKSSKDQRDLAEKFAGKDDALWKKLQKKYGVDPLQVYKQALRRERNERARKPPKKRLKCEQQQGAKFFIRTCDHGCPPHTKCGGIYCCHLNGIKDDIGGETCGVTQGCSQPSTSQKRGGGGQSKKSTRKSKSNTNTANTGRAGSDTTPADNPGAAESEEERAAAEAKVEERARKKRFCERCCNEKAIGYLCNVQCGGDIHGCAEDPDGLDDDDDDLDDILAMFDE